MADESSVTEEEVLALEGNGWDGDLEELRDDRHRLDGFER